MSTATNKLTAMFYGSTDQCNSIDDSTAQIETQIEELESQRDGIQEGVLDQSAIDMSNYLQFTKIPELGYSQDDVYIDFGVDYGVINIIDWNIKDSTSDNTVYAYEGVGWDGDTEIIGLEDDFQFGYDYIHHTNGLSGTYGLHDQIDILYSGLSILMLNKDKYEDSKNVFQKYMT